MSDIGITILFSFIIYKTLMVMIEDDAKYYEEFIAEQKRLIVEYSKIKTK